MKLFIKERIVVRREPVFSGSLRPSISKQQGKLPMESVDGFLLWRLFSFLSFLPRNDIACLIVFEGLLSSTTCFSEEEELDLLRVITSGSLEKLTKYLSRLTWFDLHPIKKQVCRFPLYNIFLFLVLIEKMILEGRLAQRNWMESILQVNNFSGLPSLPFSASATHQSWSNAFLIFSTLFHYSFI